MAQAMQIDPPQIDTQIDMRTGAEVMARLLDEGRFFGDLATPWLRAAGIVPAMRVLEIGCGAGDVTLRAARLVGPTGLVVGVDNAPDAIACGRVRATAAGLGNVHFVLSDAATYASEMRFDALIGTRILMYFTDPAVLLRRLVKFVRPGGVIAFQEFDLHAAKSFPASPLFEQALARVRLAFARMGADVAVGLKLAQIFEEAGLPTPQMVQSGRVERGPDAEIYAQVAHVSAALLPVMARVQVASAAEVAVETLAERLRADALLHDATLVAPPLIGAWTRR